MRNRQPCSTRSAMSIAAFCVSAAMGDAPVSSASLALCQAVELLIEARKGDSDAAGIANDRRAFGGERGYGEGHGDSVIAARVDFRAAQLAGATTGYQETVRALFDF